jgi:hypothetical protein
MRNFQIHMRNCMRQDQIETRYSAWLKGMTDAQLVKLTADATVWMEQHKQEYRADDELRVPARVAHEAVACLVIRLSGELTERMRAADGSVE